MKKVRNEVLVILDMEIVSEALMLFSIYYDFFW